MRNQLRNNLGSVDMMNMSMMAVKEIADVLLALSCLRMDHQAERALETIVAPEILYSMLEMLANSVSLWTRCLCRRHPASEEKQSIQHALALERPMSKPLYAQGLPVFASASCDSCATPLSVLPLTGNQRFLT